MNKMDNFGRTPLYYAFSAILINGTEITRLLVAGARLDLPKGELHLYCQPCHRIIPSVFEVLSNSFRSCEENDMRDIMTSSVTLALRDETQRSNNWLFLQILCRKIFLSFHDRKTSATVLLAFYHDIVEEVCSDLKIKCQLLKPNYALDNRLELPIELRKEKRILVKYLLLKGVPLDDYLDKCIYFNRLETVSNLLSMGVRPTRKNLHIVHDPAAESHGIDPALIDLLRGTCRTPMSLQDACRLRVHKSMNVGKAAEKLPVSIRDYIRLKK